MFLFSKPCPVLNMFLTFWLLKPCVKKRTCTFTRIGVVCQRIDDIYRFVGDEKEDLFIQCLHYRERFYKKNTLDAERIVRCYRFSYNFQ